MRKSEIMKAVREFSVLRVFVNKHDVLRKFLSDALQEYGQGTPSLRRFFSVSDRSAHYVLEGDPRDRITVVPERLARLVGHERALQLMIPPNMTHLQQMATNGELYTVGPTVRKVTPDDIESLCTREPHPDLRLTISTRSKRLAREFIEEKYEYGTSPLVADEGEE